MSKLPFKAILSTLLLLCVIYLAFTGALLYFGKTGVIMGVSRNALRASHFWVAVFICVLSITHITVNRRVYGAEFRAIRGAKDRRKDNKRGNEPTDG